MTFATARTFAAPARAGFRRRLLAWYDRQRRPLPWRGTRDPYRIWLSEIMLQQTRVAVVEKRYPAFLRRFPDVHSLARARLSSVLAAWSGLGYYRRARNLHAAARLIASRPGGVPQTAEDWRRLPGVGRYTAAAVASIAFDQPEAVVDGNVERVLRRLLPRRRSRAALWQAAAELLCPQHPGDFNQAMMELGATVCLPGKPRCSECPVARWCATRGRGVRPKPPQRRRALLTCALALRGRTVLLVQRSHAASLMPDMWELPVLAEAPPGVPLALRLRHSITTTDYTVCVVRTIPRSAPPGSVWVPTARLPYLPLTGLARKALRAVRLLA